MGIPIQVRSLKINRIYQELSHSLRRRHPSEPFEVELQRVYQTPGYFDIQHAQEFCHRNDSHSLCTPNMLQVLDAKNELLGLIPECAYKRANVKAISLHFDEKEWQKAVRHAHYLWKKLIDGGRMKKADGSLGSLSARKLNNVLKQLREKGCP